jgi:hypothetical protein
MWECIKCHEQLEDTFDVCWNCGTSKEGVEDANFRKAEDVLPEDLSTAADVEPDPLCCPRCNQRLDFVGTKSFKEWKFFGDIEVLFGGREKFDMYCCPRCGRVEFFVDGIGEQFRRR